MVWMFVIVMYIVWTAYCAFFSVFSRMCRRWLSPNRCASLYGDAKHVWCLPSAVLCLIYNWVCSRCSSCDRLLRKHATFYKPVQLNVKHTLYINCLGFTRHFHIVWHRPMQGHTIEVGALAHGFSKTFQKLVVWAIIHWPAAVAQDRLAQYLLCKTYMASWIFRDDCTLDF